MALVPIPKLSHFSQEFAKVLTALQLQKPIFIAMRYAESLLTMPEVINPVA